MTPLEIFRLVADEFNLIPDATVNGWMSLCSPMISQKAFGDLYNQALAYLTAHKMKMQGVGGDTSGLGTIGDSLRVASVSEGETSVSFGTNAQTAMQVDGEYSLTQYGIAFLTLRRLVITPIRISGENNMYG